MMPTENGKSLLARRTPWLFRKNLRWMLSLYLVLLVVSHVVWRSHRDARVVPGDRFSLTEVFDQNGRANTMAYRHVRAAGEENEPVLLLIHGTPMASETFDRVVPHLQGKAHVVVPDLPGFGFSSGKLSDYSFHTHADQLAGFIEASGWKSVHLVGYSQGGGVVVDLASRHAERLGSRIASVTLLSSIGVQEYELLGDYYFNHLLYGTQLGLIWAAENLLPHFGWLGDGLLNHAYARNFYDSDQRPMARRMRALEVPVLILHGRMDSLVPVEAAFEHHRIIPQSELVVFNGGHAPLFRDAAAKRFADQLLTFTRSVDHGRGVGRLQAAPERLAEAARPFDWSAVPPARGMTLVLVTLAIILGTLVSEDLTCVIAGFLVARGSLDFVAATLACMAGIFLGDIFLYFAGRFLGQPAVRRFPLRFFISEQNLVRSEDWFNRKGPVVILLSRFIPGTRLPTYFGAGVLKTSFWKFAAYFLLAVAIWTPILVGVATLFGDQVLRVLRIYRHYSLWGLAAGILLVFVVIKVGVPAFSPTGRCMLTGRWRRLTRCEFWPSWAYYLPLLPHMIRLAFRHRSATAFTCVNPGIPHGGFIGESKAGILENLRSAGDVIPPFLLLHADEPADVRVRKARAFSQELDDPLPVVLKPNSGERGRGVLIARSPEKLDAAVADMTEDAILQAYVPGIEFGLFYVRRPGEDCGHVLWITEKKMPVVTGDGKHTLRELILRDSRAVCMAEFYIQQQGESGFSVPSAGEEVRLAELGTHCRGAIFLDGGYLRTAALDAEMDRISKAHPGFYFGRYDVRVPSREDLQAGKNIRVIELNGVTSEATMIYDPKHRFRDVRRILREQWSLAWEIGHANHQAGRCRPTGPRGLIKLVMETSDLRRL